MSTNLDTARARLRATDPADPADPQDESARAMFERIIADPSEPVRVRARSPRRRLLLAGAAVAAVAATVTVGAVTTPWSQGHPASAAFAVDRHADGSVSVTVYWDQLRDPTALNAELARLGARTVVMRRSAPGACTSMVRIDPASFVENARWREPWREADQERALALLLVTIHPGKIPAGETLLIPYWSGPAQPGVQPSVWTMVAAKLWLVKRVPPCVPSGQ